MISACNGMFSESCTGIPYTWADDGWLDLRCFRERFANLRGLLLLL